MNDAFAQKSNVRWESLRQLSQLVQREDFAGGMRLTEKVRPIISEVNDSCTGQFRCLEAKLHLYQGDYRNALTSARLAASILAPFGESEELADAFLLAGKALVDLGNYRDAEKAFLDAESLYRRTECKNGRISAINLLARISFIKADYKAALRRLLEAKKLASETGDRKKQAYLWGNLGRVYTFLGEFKKATEALEINISLSNDLGNVRDTAKAIMSLGYIEIKSGLYEKAEKNLDKAFAIVVKQNMIREKSICRAYYGELRLRCGDLTAARRHLDEAIDGAMRIAPDSSLMVMPIRLLAELELACGNIQASSRLANKAYALARKIGETVEEGLALRTLAKIALHNSKNSKTAGEKASKLFSQAMELFHESDIRYEQAETLLEIAKSKIGSERRCLANMFRAADIYKRLGITSKYEKTQALINSSNIAVSKLKNPTQITQSNEPNIITDNRQMKNILKQLARTSVSQLPVLLIGETGTGKDLLARYYHSQSGRTGEFVAVNCAAFPETLLEAELFGYRKGAFTGAEADKEGLMHRASKGTFFLDEIGEMSPASQAKLLTVIETCRTRRLGDTKEELLDIRFIAATNCDLKSMVENGTFRRDLYFRLSGICFTIPPLADRPEDIPLLLKHFLKKEGVSMEGHMLDPELIQQFGSRSWPGNIRQFESEVKKLVLFSEIAKGDSLGELAGVLVQNDRDSETTSLVNQVEMFEKALIFKALRNADGNKSQAARSLSIHESTLRAKMKRYDLGLGIAS